MAEPPTPSPEPPPEDVVRAREAAYAEVQRRLEPWLHPGGLRVSPLGPGWSSDVDAHVTRLPEPSLLGEAGWLPLDGLLRAVGVREQGRWAVVAEGRVAGAADLHESPPPDPVEHLLARCRRQGAGPRELAEVEALRAAGHEVGELPTRRPTAPARARVGAVRRAVRPRVVVAISGVDGSGKSTLTQRVVDDLLRAGVPATRIWVRPGYIFPSVDRLARAVKRLLGEESTPGVRRAAAGEVTSVRSRQGLVGRVWGSLILLCFGVEVMRQYARARGVVVFDRHVVDAEVTLEVLYPGQRGVLWRLVARVVPAADHAFYLDLPAEVAVERKPGDPIGQWAVTRQLEEYTRLLDETVTRLDGCRPTDELAMQVLTRLTGGGDR